MQQRVQAALYGALFVVVAASAVLFLSRYGTDTRFWERFTFVYLLMPLTPERVWRAIQQAKG